jgi:hypothetical protein
MTSKRLHLKHGCDKYDHIRGMAFHQLTEHLALSYTHRKEPL